jgi:hypothetical protein
MYWRYNTIRRPQSIVAALTNFDFRVAWVGANGYYRIVSRVRPCCLSPDLPLDSEEDLSPDETLFSHRARLYLWLSRGHLLVVKTKNDVLQGTLALMVLKTLARGRCTVTASLFIFRRFQRICCGSKRRFALPAQSHGAGRLDRCGMGHVGEQSSRLRNTTQLRLNRRWNAERLSHHGGVLFQSLIWHNPSYIFGVSFTV